MHAAYAKSHLAKFHHDEPASLRNSTAVREELALYEILHAKGKLRHCADRTLQATFLMPT
jgi:hypothetical protein